MELDYIHPSRIKDFFRHICAISPRYVKKNHPREFVNSKERHLTVIPVKKYKKESLKSNDANQLKSRINELEEHIEHLTLERDTAIDKNKAKIDDLTLSLLSIKTKVQDILHLKGMRERRIRELEHKINKKR